MLLKKKNPVKILGEEIGVYEIEVIYLYPTAKNSTAALFVLSFA